MIFLSFFAIVAEGLTEDFGGGGGASSSSSSSTSIDLVVTGFALAFVMARHRVSSTQASSLQNSVKEHFDVWTSSVLAIDALLRSKSWLA